MQISKIILILIIGVTTCRDIHHRHEICQMFYTSKIPKVFKFTGEKLRKSQHFLQKMIIQDGLLVYFVQIVSFHAIINSNTKSFQLFYENSSLNLTNFTELVVSHVILKKFTQTQNYLTQVPLVTKSMSDSSSPPLGLVGSPFSLLKGRTKKIFFLGFVP